jgi:hypothetical protein
MPLEWMRMPTSTHGTITAPPLFAEGYYRLAPPVTHYGQSRSKKSGDIAFIE